MDKNNLPFLPTTPINPGLPNAPALFDDSSASWMTYKILREKMMRTVARFEPEERTLVLCCMPRTTQGVIAYLAAAEAGHAILLAAPDAPNLAAIVATYEPEWIVTPKDFSFEGYEGGPTQTLPNLAILKRQVPSGQLINPDLFLVLLTSGSTGNPKGVRLSYKNLSHNTTAIVQSLNLNKNEIALAHLPLAYSFGLSVLHAQLAVGGACVLTERSMMNSDFWNLARAQKVTLFPGVPYHYEMLMRLGLNRLKLPSLTCFIQAGGKMSVPATYKLYQEIKGREKARLYIMYGQTEASPRMACLPVHEFPDKIGTAGLPLDCGRFEIVDGEVIYTGPNVMMGYATNRADLARGDTRKGRLATGDSGALDGDGFLLLSGRKSRFAKLFGYRVALDDLEQIAAPLAFTIALEHPDKIVLLTNEEDTALHEEIKTRLVRQTNLPAPWFEIRCLKEMPLKSNGKVDYQEAMKFVA